MPEKPTSKFAFLPWAGIFWAAGVAFFYWIGSMQADLQENLAAIERGEATQITVTIDKKWIQPGSGTGADQDPDSHWISFENIEGIAEDVDRIQSHEEYQAVHVGQEFIAHVLGDEVVIEKMDKLQPKAKWIMLGFCVFLGMIPMSMTCYGSIRNPEND